jgi:hypothetical protein
MGDGPDGLIVSQARNRAAIHDLEDASFGPGCGIGGLIEEAPLLQREFDLAAPGRCDLTST